MKSLLLLLLFISPAIAQDSSVISGNNDFSVITAPEPPQPCTVGGSCNREIGSPAWREWHCANYKDASSCNSDTYKGTSCEWHKDNICRPK